MTADPEARGDQWRGLSGVYGNRGQGNGMRGDGMYADGTDVGRQDHGGSPGRGRRAAAILALILGLVGFAASMTGVAIQLLPRQFTASQQRQIEAWEVMRRWQTMPAGQIFPASVSYPLSAQVLQDAALNLDALRVSIAPQVSDCAKAVTSTAGAVLRRNGCEAVLRATYIDATRSYVMTVGVAVLPTASAAVSVGSGLSQARLATVARDAADAARLSAGVLVVRFKGAAARLYDYNRQISASFTAGPYVVMYTAGYADSRPRVPVTHDTYSDAEMTSMAAGVAHSIANVLAANPAPPHCPGSPGC